MGGEHVPRPPKSPDSHGRITVAFLHVTVTSSRNISLLMCLENFEWKARVVVGQGGEPGHGQPGHLILGGQKCPGSVPGHGDKEKDKLPHLRLCLPSREQGHPCSPHPPPTPTPDQHSLQSQGLTSGTPPSLHCSYPYNITPQHKQSNFYLKNKLGGQKQNQSTKIQHSHRKCKLPLY